MSWSARIEHVDGGLAIQFAEPLSRLTMTSDTAAHFASLLAIEARHQMAGLVRTLDGDRRTASTASLVPAVLPFTVIGAHALCCDCDPCLNGDPSKLESGGGA